jgi:hypothetical protein
MSRLIRIQRRVLLTLVAVAFAILIRLIAVFSPHGQRQVYKTSAAADVGFFKQAILRLRPYKLTSSLASPLQLGLSNPGADLPYLHKISSSYPLATPGPVGLYPDLNAAALKPRSGMMPIFSSCVVGDQPTNQCDVNCGVSNC